MSIYDEREKPAYKNFRLQIKDSENPFILKWWTPTHDNLLCERIKKDQWIWYWNIREDILCVTTAIITYLRELAHLIQRIPTQDFGGGVNDLMDLTSNERLALFKLLLQKPSLYRIKKLYGSWPNALVDAGILENGTRPTSRGTQCLAKDGHVCFSLAEKTIDDFLFSRGIPHKRETKYPEGNFRTDFSVQGIFIEYFGLMGNAEYELKAKLKRNLCEKHKAQLISIYPRDLLSLKKLEQKLNIVLALKKYETN